MHWHTLPQDCQTCVTFEPMNTNRAMNLTLQVLQPPRPQSNPSPTVLCLMLSQEIVQVLPDAQWTYAVLLHAKPCWTWPLLESPLRQPHLTPSLHPRHPFPAQDPPRTNPQQTSHHDGRNDIHHSLRRPQDTPAEPLTPRSQAFMNDGSGHFVLSRQTHSPASSPKHGRQLNRPPVQQGSPFQQGSDDSSAAAACQHDSSTAATYVHVPCPVHDVLHPTSNASQQSDPSPAVLQKTRGCNASQQLDFESAMHDAQRPCNLGNSAVCSNSKNCKSSMPGQGEVPSQPAADCKCNPAGKCDPVNQQRAVPISTAEHEAAGNEASKPSGEAGSKLLFSGFVSFSQLQQQQQQRQQQGGSQRFRGGFRANASLAFAWRPPG